MSTIRRTMETLSMQRLKSAVVNIPEHNLTIELTDHQCKKQPDDRVYKKSKDLWKELPRGCCDVVIKESDKKDGTAGAILGTYQLRGLPKFGYEEDIPYYSFEHTESDVHEYVLQTKENGECFHVMPIQLVDGRWVVVFGSKNVHAAWVFNNPIDVLDTQWLSKIRQVHYSGQRYGYAFMLMEQFVQDLRRIAQSGKKVSSDAIDRMFRWWRGRTAAAEACDTKRAEHLVTYDEPSLCWFSLRDPLDRDSFLMAHPFSLRRDFEMLGLKVPQECVVVKADDEKNLQAVVNRFSTMDNSEGCVRCAVTTDGRTLYMVKDKNVKYVRHRAVREKVKQGASTAELVQRLLRLHVPYDAEFKNWAVRFNAWVQWSIWSGALQKKEVDEHYMGVRQAYDDACVEDQTVGDRILQWWNQKITDKVVILVASPCQGSGKTKLATTLAIMLRSHGSHGSHGSQRVNQDDCQGNRRLFMKTLKAAYEDPDVRYIIVDKWNNSQNRRDALRTCPKASHVLVTLEHKDGPEALVNLCTSRIMNERKEKHPSLKASLGEQKIRGILTQFASRWDAPDENEYDEYDTVMDLDVTSTTESQVFLITTALKKSNLWNTRINTSTTSNTNKSRMVHETKVSVDDVLYWKVSVDPTAVKNALMLIPCDLNPQHLRQEFHITLCFLGRCTPKQRAQQNSLWGAKEGKTVTFQLSSLDTNGKSWALRLKDPCVDLEGHTQDVLHITAGHLPHVKPFESNAMLKNPTHSWPCSETLTGVVEKVCK
jgi:hypothetical protein